MSTALVNEYVENGGDALKQEITWAKNAIPLQNIQARCSPPGVGWWRICGIRSCSRQAPIGGGCRLCND